MSLDKGAPRDRRVQIDPPLPGDRRPNYVTDPEAIFAVARAWADAGPVPRVHRAAQKEIRRSFPLLARHWTGSPGSGRDDHRH